MIASVADRNAAPHAATAGPVASRPGRATPLWAVFGLTFLCSIGSGIIYGGIFFLAKSRYGFTTADNFLLALVFGAAYIPGALSAGPLQRALRSRGVTPRTILYVIMLAMAAVCAVPWIADRLAPASTSTWPIWVVVIVYSPVSGMLWPIVESFLAGGRTERQLRTATGRFNIVWSSAIVLSMFTIAPFIESAPLEILLTLGFIHLTCTAIITRFEPSPAVHEHHEHHRPIVYRQLLTFLRMLLPVSFMFNSALSPYMPSALNALGVPLAWQTPVVATWYSTRVLTFLSMERWHGWHGRWTTPIFGTLLLLASFAWLVVVPMLAPAGFGLPLFILGLAGFGVGVGVIYAAALYYAMEVGASGVDAGGTHEALIGVGYTAGPICGLAAAGAVSAGIAPATQQSPIMLGLVSAAAVVVGGCALAKARHLRRQASTGDPVSRI